MRPKASVVILNWNGWKDTIECLESLYRISYENYDVVVLDNGSKNDSVQRIRDYCAGILRPRSDCSAYDDSNKPIEVVEVSSAEAERPRGVTTPAASRTRLILILSDSNLGFAGGCNLAVSYSLKALQSDYVLLLNNDTIVDRDFLSHLVTAAAGNDSVGIAGSKIYYYEHEGGRRTINYAGGRIDMKTGTPLPAGFSELDEGQYEEVSECSYVGGGSMLISRRLVERIGCFDPEYFAYWEDADLCVRAGKAGFKMLCVPQSIVWHKIGRSQVGGTSAYYFAKNRFRFMKKHASKENYRTFVRHLFLLQFWPNWISYLLNRDLRGFFGFAKGTVAGIALSLDSKDRGG